MKTTFVIGAGFSKSYSQSKTQQRMPIAKDFFRIFNSLSIASNGWVLVGALLNFCRDRYNTSYDEFENFDTDIETIHSEVYSELKKALKERDHNKVTEMWMIHNQLIFLFSSVINEIQNGELSFIHDRFVKILNDSDTILTFNWDTLIDRSLSATNRWSVDDGYLITPIGIYENGWREPTATTSNIKLLKLHGSTNWITSYPTINNNWEIIHSHPSGPSSIYIYKNTGAPYPCFDGRYMDGYEEFSYGYYPPNVPEAMQVTDPDKLRVRNILRNGINPKGASVDNGIASMPLIIPPVREKEYDFYGKLFPHLWSAAESEIAESDNIVIIGYSFPQTDIHSRNLFKKAFQKMTRMPKVTIVNPEPDLLQYIITNDFGITSEKLIILRELIDENFDFNRLI